MCNLIRILWCFYMVSGLRINILKSRLLGVRVTETKVSSLDTITVFSLDTFPFIYLGIPIGESMV